VYSVTGIHKSFNCIWRCNENIFSIGL